MVQTKNRAAASFFCNNEVAKTYDSFCAYFTKRISNTPAMSSNISMTGTHLCKLRDTPASRCYGRIFFLKL